VSDTSQHSSHHLTQQIDTLLQETERALTVSGEIYRKAGLDPNQRKRYAEALRERLTPAQRSQADRDIATFAEDVDEEILRTTVAIKSQSHGGHARLHASRLRV